MKGTGKENILAIPLEKRGKQPGLFDTMHQSDSLGLLDLLWYHEALGVRELNLGEKGSKNVLSV